MNQLTTADKIAAYLGTGLIVLGVVGIGLLEIIAGSPHPVSTEGQIVHEALVPLWLRSYMIILGLLLWGLYGIYRVLGTTPAQPEAA